MVELVCLTSTSGVHDMILDIIVELDITVQVVEVVYGVARKLVLPKRFIKNFLSRSIVQCAQTDDLIAQVNSHLWIILLFSDINFLESHCASVMRFSPSIY